MNFQHWNAAGSCNLSSWNTRNIYCTLNTLIADDMVTRGTVVSVAMILTYLSRNVLQILGILAFVWGVFGENCPCCYWTILYFLSVEDDIGGDEEQSETVDIHTIDTLSPRHYLQKGFSYPFSWSTIVILLFKSQWGLFLRVQFTLSLHWFINGLALRKQEAIIQTNDCLVHLV